MNDPHPRWLFLLQRIALVLFTLLPVGFSLIVQIQYVSGNWSIPLFVRTSLLVGLLLLPLVAVLLRDDLWNAIEGTGYIPLVWVITLAIALRLIVLPLLSTNFTSDMLDMHLFAVDVVSGRPFANLEAYQGIPWAVHLNMTGLLTSVVYRIFGATFATAKMFMVVLAGLSVWLIYLAGKEVAGAPVGLTAAALYGTLPSLVTYSGVLSGEHLALPLLLLSIFLYARLKNADENRLRYAVAGYALCGITIGLVDWFRPGGIILVTALLISDLLYWVKDKRVGQQLLPLAALVISYLTVSNTAVLISERFFGRDVMSAVQQSGHFILLGLNVEHNGVINNEDRQIAFDVYEQFGDDNTAANLYLVQMALERLKGQPVLELFRSKFALLWANHWQLFQISLNGSNDQEVVRVLSDIDSAIYLLLTLFIVVNIYASFVYRSHPAVFAMQLFILGFAIWSLVLEAQNRYAISTYPYQILLGTLGLFALAAYLKRRKNAPSI
jgi:4-amino-4-deoxy-L-arabinose transferase-like glycosyltransferase